VLASGDRGAFPLFDRPEQRGDGGWVQDVTAVVGEATAGFV